METGIVAQAFINHPLPFMAGAALIILAILAGMEILINGWPYSNEPKDFKKPKDKWI